MRAGRAGVARAFCAGLVERFLVGLDGGTQALQLGSLHLGDAPLDAAYRQQEKSGGARSEDHHHQGVQASSRSGQPEERKDRYDDRVEQGGAQSAACEGDAREERSSRFTRASAPICEYERVDAMSIATASPTSQPSTKWRAITKSIRGSENGSTLA